MDDAKGKVETPSIGVSLNAQYAGGRTVVFQTHVPQSINVDGLNVILDKFNAVADRAEAYYAQEQARRQLETEENAALNIAKRLEEVETNIQLKALEQGNRRNPKLSAQETVAKKQAEDSVADVKRRIDASRKFLADLIVKAGNRNGAASPTDS